MYIFLLIQTESFFSLHIFRVKIVLLFTGTMTEAWAYGTQWIRQSVTITKTTIVQSTYLLCGKNRSYFFFIFRQKCKWMVFKLKQRFFSGFSITNWSELNANVIFNLKRVWTADIRIEESLLIRGYRPFSNRHRHCNAMTHVWGSYAAED